VKELTFSGNHRVERDTLGLFATPEWVEGRAQQSPVCYTRNTQIQISTAKFTVTRKPSATETVAVRGKATFGSASIELTGTVSVSPSDTVVTVSSLTANVALPNQVDLFETTDIAWEMNPASTGWAGAGTTRNVVYVTLGNPSGTPAYWTLLDISCRAARGETTPGGVIRKSFVPLTTRSVKRKRDSRTLTYWNPDTTTVTNTRDLLASADGSGQCGSWAEFLIDMYKAHGITTAKKIVIVRNIPDFSNSRIGFLVKSWTFHTPPATTHNTFTHSQSQVTENPGVPGQSNANPPPAFFNHFIVLADGKLYDPSYGAGPINNKVAWESGSIDGLFRRTPPPMMHGFDKRKPAIASANILEYYDLSTMTPI
jgi:hypothetical protein